MTNLTLNLDTVAALRAVQALGQAASDLSGLYEAIGEGVVDSTIDRFGSSTAPDGSKWLPNTQVTYLKYLKKFSAGSLIKKGKNAGKLSSAGSNRISSKKPLISEGELSTTIRKQVDADGVSIGSGVKYASTQQFGATARSFKGGKTPWGNIPARPFLGLNGDDEKSITELALEHLRQALDK